jgi:hypothetical protein
MTARTVRITAGLFLLGVLLSVWWVGNRRERAEITDASVQEHKPQIRVLFLGSTLTSRNGLPGMVARMAQQPRSPRNVVAEFRTAGRSTLRELWEDARVRTALDGGWRFVVVQGQSTEPVDHAAEFAEYADRFAAAGTEKSTSPVFFETWARRWDHPLYENKDLGVESPRDMQRLVRGAYLAVHERTGARIARVGDAFETVTQRREDLELFDADGANPSVLGTYLAAAVFYGIFTGDSPLNIDWWPESITEGDAAFLRTVAAETLALSD